jgi:hypothetical protein
LGRLLSKKKNFNKRFGELINFLNLDERKRLKSQFWKNERERSENSILLWWKRYYNYSCTDPRFIEATWRDVYEDYLDFLLLQDEKEASILPHREAERELEKWTEEIEADPQEWERWRKAQEENLRKFKEKVLLCSKP